MTTAPPVALINSVDHQLKRFEAHPPSSSSSSPTYFSDDLSALTRSPASRALRRIGSAASDAVFGGAGSVQSGILTLASCTIGTGVLALPAALAESGVAIGLVLILASAGFNIWSCMLLVHSSLMSRQFSYRSIGVAAFGEAGGKLVKISVILVLFGIIIGLLVVLRDTIYEVVLLFTPEPASRWILSAGVIAVLILPLSLPSSITALKYTSLLALASICYVTGVVVLCGVNRISYFGNLTAAVHAAQTEKATGGNFWLPVQDDPTVPGWLKVITNIPVFCMAFSCQVQVPDIFKTLKGAGSQKSMKDMQNVVTGALCGCLVLYLSIAMLGVFAFVGAFAHLHGDVLDSLTMTIASDSGNAAGLRSEISAALLIMCFSVSLTCPLLVLPCRDTIMQMLLPNSEDTDGKNDEVVTAANHHGQKSAVYTSSPLARPFIDDPESSTHMGDVHRNSEVHTRSSKQTEMSNKWPCWRLAVHGFVTLFILTAGWALANTIPNLKLVLGITGSTGGSLLLYVLPAIFYLKLLNKKRVKRIETLVASGKDRRLAEDAVGRSSTRELFFGFFPLVVGTLVGVIATGATIYGVVQGSHDNNMTLAHHPTW